tara:strand:- start:381 stop:566 length:186 start_codon:yes stop_codon:yes gene_type:complete
MPSSSCSVVRSSNANVAITHTSQFKPMSDILVRYHVHASAAEIETRYSGKIKSIQALKPEL